MTDRALLIDDDPWALALLRARLQARLPRLAIDTRTEPRLEPGDDHDVFVVDDRFGASRAAVSLVHRARRAAPGALVVAMGAGLDEPTLRRLCNAGVDLACDKTEPRDLDRLVEAVAARVERAPARRAGPAASALDLLREWRRRLTACEVEEEASR